jgi:hypothetical protein
MEIKAVDSYYLNPSSSVYNYATQKTPADENKVSEVDNNNPVEEVTRSSESLLIDVSV